MKTGKYEIEKYLSLKSYENRQHILVKKFMIIINCQEAKIFMIIIKLLSRRSNLFFGNFGNFRNFRKSSCPQLNTEVLFIGL